MSTYSSQVRPDQLRLTEAARNKMAELLSSADDDIEGVRIYVSGGGCGGMNYGMTFTENVGETDVVLKEGDVSIFVDAVALGFMNGTEIDFVDQGVNASFVFNNAFSKSASGGSCGGCGSSGGGCA